MPLRDQLIPWSSACRPENSRRTILAAGFSFHFNRCPRRNTVSFTVKLVLHGILELKGGLPGVDAGTYPEVCSSNNTIYIVKYFHLSVYV